MRSPGSVDILSTRPSGKPQPHLGSNKLQPSPNKCRLQPLDDEYRRTHGASTKRAKVAQHNLRRQLAQDIHSQLNQHPHSSARKLSPLGKSIGTPEHGKTVRSFIINFLSDDFGELKRSIDLVKHGKDTGAPITDGVLQELSDLHPHVESLNLHGCAQVTDVGLWALARNCIDLKRLFLGGCDQITHIGLRSLSLRCSHLEELDLKDCARVTDLGLRVIAAGFFNLRRLCLEGCDKVTDGGVLQVAQCCPNLEKLSLKGCGKLSEFGDRALVEIGKGCSRLVELDLTNCTFVTDAGIRALARGCNALEVLRVSQCGLLTGAAVRALGKGCQRLSSLGCGALKLLRNEDIWWLAESLPKIKNLSLRSVVELKTYGIRGLCEYAKELQMLNLAECCYLDDDSLLVIANSLGQLKSINICHNNNYTRQGVKAMCHGCTRLVRVEAMHTPLTRKDMAYIAKDLPFVKPADDRVALMPVPGAYAMIKATEKMRIDTAAAVCIQKMFRGVKARGGARLIRLHARRRWVIPQFQSIFRGYITRKKLFLEKQMRDQTKAAHLLQRYYRGHKGRERARVARRIRDLRRNQNLAAIRIQSIYRGCLGRKAAKEARRLRALAALRAHEARRQEEAMAVHIQRTFRGRVGRKRFSAALFRAEHQREIERRRNQAATIIQSFWRMLVGMAALAELRAAKQLRMAREAAARKIQTFYRCTKARTVVEAIKITRQWQKEEESARKIQRCWRGCVGRQLAALVVSFEQLRRYEAGEATKIQGWWRALQGRKQFLSFKQIRALQARESKAAVAIQRVFRGHKGREEREVRGFLVRIHDVLQPLYERKDRLEQEQVSLGKDLEKKRTWLEEAEKRVSNMKVELVEISKHKAKYYDSSNITGALQRYQTKYLGQALRVQIETLEVEIDRCANKVLIELEANLRGVEKELREACREVDEKESTTTFDVRHKRAFRIRQRLQKREDSAAIIQRAYRSHRVQSALSLYGQFIGEYWDEENESFYYYNRKTRERYERKPWEYKVLHEAGDILLALGQASNDNGWIRELDETSGYYYYYHPLTEEYRWEEPKSAEHVENEEWLQENIEQLTARSTQTREANDWVEYETEDGQRYYYHQTTGESTWTKPDGFDNTWVQQQDKEQFEVARTDGSYWQELVDEKGNTYYCNMETGESCWEKPPDFEDTWLAENKEVFTARSIRLRDINSEWQELVDPETKYTYYWNAKTGEARWSLPPEETAVVGNEGLEQETPIEETAVSTAESFQEVEEDGKVNGQDGAPEEAQVEWTEHVDEASGEKYFYNNFTGESIWAADALFPSSTDTDND